MDAVTLDHVVLEVRDADRSAVFYHEVLGLTPVRLDEFRRGEVKFPSVRVAAGTVFDLFPPGMWRQAQARNLHHLCLATSAMAVAALRERLDGLGIAITNVDNHNFGARGFGRSIYFQDPDGISIEVRYYE
jgi:catechol 2,3-dioxygenase-like lactoylglutathione lyase family enzyme